MENKKIRKQLHDNVHSMLIQEFEDELYHLSTTCKMSQLGTCFLLLNSVINMDNIMFPVSAAAAVFTEIVYAIHYVKKLAINRTIENETNAVVDSMINVNNAIISRLSPLVNVMGENILGYIVVDSKEPIIMQVGKNDSEDIIEVECEVVNDNKTDELSELQRRAHALFRYIEDVAYQDYQVDLTAIDNIIRELENLTYTMSISDYNLAINELAYKAYNNALELYGISR